MLKLWFFLKKVNLFALFCWWFQKFMISVKNLKKSVPRAKFSLHDKSSYWDFPWLLFELLGLKKLQKSPQIEQWEIADFVKIVTLSIIQYPHLYTMLCKIQCHFQKKFEQKGNNTDHSFGLLFTFCERYLALFSLCSCAKCTNIA